MTKSVSPKIATKTRQTSLFREYSTTTAIPALDDHFSDTRSPVFRSGGTASDQYPDRQPVWKDRDQCRSAVIPAVSVVLYTRMHLAQSRHKREKYPANPVFRHGNQRRSDRYLTQLNRKYGSGTRATDEQGFTIRDKGQDNQIHGQEARKGSHRMWAFFVSGGGTLKKTRGENYPPKAVNPRMNNLPVLRY